MRLSTPPDSALAGIKDGWDEDVTLVELSNRCSLDNEEAEKGKDGEEEGVKVQAPGSGRELHFRALGSSVIPLSLKSRWLKYSLVRWDERKSERGRTVEG